MSVNAVAINNVRKMNINRKPKSDKEMSYQQAAGRMLSKARIDNGMEVEQLAELLRSTYPLDVGFNRTSLYKHEKGERTLTPYRLSCIAQALRLPISQLFDVDTRDSEVANIYANVDIQAPFDFKKINKGDALITSPLNFECVDDLKMRGYYVSEDKKGDTHLFYIIPSENPNQFAVERRGQLEVMAFSELLKVARSMYRFARIDYTITPINQVS
jgi:transcriptional regulator with XRE-family HTH domain